MKVKEFYRFHLVPEQALKLLAEEIHDFLKKDKSIEVISLSHSLFDPQSTNKNFMDSALLCYK